MQKRKLFTKKWPVFSRPFFRFALAIMFLVVCGSVMYADARHDIKADEITPPSANHEPKPVLFDKAPTNPPPTAPAAPATTAPKKEVVSSHRSIPILEYHHIRNFANIDDTAGYWTSVSPNLFDSQMAALHAAGYETISFADYIAGKANNHSIILTFDDGAADAYTDAYPILQKNGYSGTFYLISSYLNTPEYLTRSQVAEMAGGGMNIGSHTLSHFNLSQIDEPDANAQINDSKTLLEATVGKPVVDFCFPFGGDTDRLADLVKQAGYESATTTNKPSTTSFNNYFELPRLSVTMKDSPATLLKRVDRVEGWN